MSELTLLYQEAKMHGLFFVFVFVFVFLMSTNCVAGTV
jgi:hypothetical protein